MQKGKAVLLIAKLDRLARNMVFISTLMQSDVEFIAVDNPYAGKLIVHIMAAFAEHERDQISLRTREALQAAKKRGVQLGAHGKYVLSQRNKKAAKDFVVKMTPVLSALQAKGFRTIRQLTDELNRLKIPPFHGSTYKWHVTTVHNILKRIHHLQTQKTIL